MRLTIATAVLACTTALAVPGTAAADTPGCVTHHEWHKAVKGMYRWRVHRIFDTTGVQLWHQRKAEKRRYRVCHGGHVTIRYKGRPDYNGSDTVARKSAWPT